MSWSINALRLIWRRSTRLTGMVSLLFLGLAITLFIFPFVDRQGHRRLIAWWSGLLMNACGVRIRTEISERAPDLEQFSPGAGNLILANHASWLDIFVINQFAAARFVAKSEIARWPLVGMLVARVGTLFIERGKRRAVHQMLGQVSEHLTLGDTVAVFPEGMISPGDYLLPFHANLVQAAIDARTNVVPMGIRYQDPDGKPSQAMAYVGDMTFLESVWRIVSAPGIIAQLYLLDPIAIANEDKRQDVARRARLALSQKLDLALQDTVPEILRHPGGGQQ